MSTGGSQHFEVKTISAFGGIAVGLRLLDWREKVRERLSEREREGAGVETLEDLQVEEVSFNLLFLRRGLFSKKNNTLKTLIRTIIILTTAAMVIIKHLGRFFFCLFRRKRPDEALGWDLLRNLLR